MYFIMASTPLASGMAPVTGIPLPGVSYGLNSRFSVAIAFGFLHLAALATDPAYPGAAGGYPLPS